MFRSISTAKRKHVKIRFEGVLIKAEEGETVACSLLRSGFYHFRSAGLKDLRGPYCMMGTCFECLLEIDGKPNCQACQTVVSEGMEIKRQKPPKNEKNFDRKTT